MEKEILIQELEKIKTYYFDKGDYVSYNQVGRAIDVAEDYYFDINYKSESRNPMKKMTKQDFQNYIISEAKKLYKIEVLKEQKNNIDKQIKMLNENEFGDDFERESREVEHDINPHKELSSEEQQVLDDILNVNLNEGFDSIVQKVKQYASKGMLTAGIIAALMSTPGIASAQKAQIKQVAKTEMSQKKQSPYQSKEWQQVKQAGLKTHGKLLQFKSMSDGSHQESLNWGSHKIKGLTNGMSISMNHDGTLHLILTSDRSDAGNANLMKITNVLNKSGLGNFKDDTYETSANYEIPATAYQSIINGINNVTPLLK
jgi:hypothetical protein